MKCLHPVKVKTPLGERLLPCGKCEACKLRASSFNTLVCQIEQTHNRFMYFVTLTYDNEHVPRFKVIDRWNEKFPYVSLQCVTPRLSIYNKKFRYDCDEVELKKLRHILKKRSSTLNFLTFTCYEDIQKFMKRLRKHTDKYEKIRYYVAGDYGPKTFRAHWHLLLFFDSEKLAQVIRLYVHKSWSFGFEDTSAASGGKSVAYTANYVNCSTVLPPVFKTDELKARTYHSVYFGTKDFDKNHFALLTNPTDNLSFHYIIDGKSIDTSPFRSCQLRLFPKPVGYHEKSYEQIKYSYNVHKYAKELFGDHPVTTLAELIVNADVLSNPITAYFYSRYACFHPENLRTERDKKRFVGRVARYLYISKRFQQMLQKFKIPCDICIQFIQNWYDVQSQITLKRWYQEQERDAKDCILHQTISRYYDDTFPVISSEIGYKPVVFEDTPLYRHELYLAHKKTLEKIKHRKLNEANGYLVAFDYKQYETVYKPLKNLKYG